MTSSGCATSRVVAERRRARALRLLAAALVAAPLAAQSAPAPTTFELGRSVQQSLARLQDDWLQWVGANLQEDPARAEATLRAITATASEVGFSRLPDLALAAAAQARRSADEGAWDRAELQLDAADALSQDEPEVRFSEAAVARARGRWISAVSSTVRGLAATWRSAERVRIAGNLAIWLAFLLQLTSGLYVLLLAWTHGPATAKALRHGLAPRLSDGIATLFVVALVLAPLALPNGPFWWLMLWSALLWSYASPSERAVLVIGWLLVAASPWFVERAQRSLILDQSPPMRAWSAFERNRLYGSFFSDLEVLRTAVPDHSAAMEFTADIHRTIGQWDVARSFYRRVLYNEPENVSVLLNLGAYHFRKGEFALANSYFERGTRSGAPSAAAWYNLSLGTSEAYLFDESRDALSSAREIDGPSVDRWLATPNPDRVLTFNGSLARRAELRAALVAAWEGDPDAGREAPSLPEPHALAPLGALAVAFGFDRWRRRRSGVVGKVAPAATSRFGRWVERLVPAIPAAGRGNGPLAWANLFFLVLLLWLPRATDFAGEPGIPSWPGPTLALALAVVAALAYVGIRVRVAWLEAEG